MRSRWERPTRLTLSCAAVVAVAAFAADRWRAYRHRVAPTVVTPRAFERDGWLSGNSSHRHAMARQLLADFSLVGLTRAELEELLGASAGGTRPGTLEWVLGERADPTGMMWNYDEFLIVWFDEDGRCKHAEIYSRD